jgi:hypothetical protein
MHKSTSSNDKKIGLKQVGVGVGGMKCYCCAPSPRHRKMILRIAKRIAKREALKDDFIDLDKRPQDYIYYEEKELSHAV